VHLERCESPGFDRYGDGGARDTIRPALNDDNLSQGEVVALMHCFLQARFIGVLELLHVGVCVKKSIIRKHWLP
jgi:hypothetical protein